MEIQKEKNLYLAKLLEQEVIKQDEFEDLVFKPEINAFHSNYLSSRFMDNINFGWSAWQAAKAQAVPEGFFLVKMDDLELLRDSALKIKYASLSNDSDRIFSDIEDIQLSVERLIELQEPAND